MKIAIITDALTLGGAERQIAVSAAELVRSGEEVEVIRYHQANDFEEFLRIHNVKSVFLPPVGPFRLGRVFALSRYLRAGRFDVVHAFKGVSSLYGQIASNLAGVPCFFAGYRAQASLSPIHRMIVQFLCKRASGWIVNSEGVKKTVISDFKVPPEKVFIVPNGIPINEFQSSLAVGEAKRKFGFPSDQFVISFIANFRPVKNPEMFFRVVERLVKSGMKIQVLVAGFIPQVSQAELMCQGLGIEGHIKLLGTCGEICDVFRATDVLLLTSHKEGLPNVLIEAGAFDIPCVSTENGAEEVIMDGYTGYVVPLDDDEAMAEKITILFNNPDLKRKMGKAAGQRVVKDFSTEALCRNLVRVYRTGLLDPSQKK